MTAAGTAGSMSLDEIDIHTTSEYRRRGYPWEAWDRLRAEAPVYWYERPGIEPFWAITRYHDIQWVSANDRLFVNGGGRLRLATIEEDQAARERRVKRAGELGWDPQEPMDMVFMDRPRHTQFRSLTARRFTPRAIRGHQPDLVRYAARFAGELVQKLERDGEADLVMDFAVKLPLATICDLLGLPADDWSKVFDFTEIVTDEELAEAHPGIDIGELRMQRARSSGSTWPRSSRAAELIPAMTCWPRSSQARSTAARSPRSSSTATSSSCSPPATRPLETRPPAG